MTIHVAVLRGGPSNKYEHSLHTGSAILSHIPKDIYTPYDVFIDKKGNWNHAGITIQPYDLFNKVDVIFNALHGSFGEDGKLQQILDHHKIPYTGSDSLSSAIASNKILSKKAFSEMGIKTPFHKEIRHALSPREIFLSMPLPFTISHIDNSGEKYIIKSYLDLEEVLPKIYSYSHDILLEEIINGLEIGCGVVENFRDIEYYNFPPIFKNQNNNFLEDYNLKNTVQNYAILAHKNLGLKHYSHSDFIFHPKRGVFIVGISPLPELHEKSHFSKSVTSVGSSLSHFIDHILQLALKRK